MSREIPPEQSFHSQHCLCTDVGNFLSSSGTERALVCDLFRSPKYEFQAPKTTNAWDFDFPFVCLWMYSQGWVSHTLARFCKMSDICMPNCFGIRMKKICTGVVGPQSLEVNQVYFQSTGWHCLPDLFMDLRWGCLVEAPGVVDPDRHTLRVNWLICITCLICWFGLCTAHKGWMTTHTDGFIYKQWEEVY